MNEHEFEQAREDGEGQGSLAKSLILFRFFELHILVLATLEPMVIATTDYLIIRNSTQDHIITFQAFAQVQQ